MGISNKFKNAVLTSTLTTPLLVAGATEVIRITHIVATCTAVNSGTLTLKSVDSSASNLSTNLLNAVPFTAGKPIEFFDGFLESGDSLQGGFAGTPTDAHVIIFYQVETP